MTKKKGSFIRTLLNLLVVVPSLMSVTKKVVTLIGFEAQLAGRSMMRMIVFSFIFFILMASTWCCALVMMFFYFTLSLSWSWLAALGTLVFINLVLLLIIACLMTRTKKNLFFPMTRKQLSRRAD